MDKWVKFSDILPPKNKPFLSYSFGLIEICEWKERTDRSGWYGFVSPCACCLGYCSTNIMYWQPLPEPPEELNEVV